MPAYSQSTIHSRSSSAMKFAFSRSLWHGRRVCGPRSLSTPAAIPAARSYAAGSERRGVLGTPVDPEELRVLAADAKDVLLAVHEHLEVVVRDASAEPLEHDRPPRPQARCD